MPPPHACFVDFDFSRMKMKEVGKVFPVKLEEVCEDIFSEYVEDLSQLKGFMRVSSTELKGTNWGGKIFSAEPEKSPGGIFIWKDILWS